VILDIKDYIGRVYVIHLPERTDRFAALERELARLGIDLKGNAVRIPHAPRPDDANGFPSRGVYGNFLSHLSILKEALADGLETVLVLEDDAIFSRRMVREQSKLVDFLQRNAWDLCFFGHSLKDELRGCEKGLVPHRANFMWAHCYAVHKRALPELISYFEMTMTLPPDDPRGSHMYIDGAFSLFRNRHPHIVTLVSNPVLSIQKGSPSNIAGTGWYAAFRPVLPLISFLRAARDQWWRVSS
jgi:glycosyl transferase family 25